MGVVVRPRARSWLVVGTTAALLLATAGLSGTAAVAAPGGATRSAPGTHPTFPARTITLLTGDRVVLGGDPTDPTVSLAPATRDGGTPSFYSYRAGGDLYVIPSDVAALVGGVLDPALFDVTALAADRYTDADTGSLPLIVRGAAPTALSARARGAVTVDRRLDSIDAVAVHVRKSDAAALGTALAAQTRRIAPDQVTPLRSGPLAGVTHIWLDQPVHATRLDTNLTQITAPAAWRHGLTGAGVRVAVLDTGIDTSHPDLAGKVVAEANFTPTSDTGDHVGHGTHVASIAAGSGAGSHQRRGVAYGANLLNGKVLDDSGNGLASWIIAGMQWAVQQHARVVNLSVGSGTASDGSDPISQAVDELSAESDTLFVVAAGNTGGFARVNSPGAAEAALTVGAVDAHDALAPFSAVGPRAGDGAVKPDITAPGVGIIAARAAGTRLDEPVDAEYVRASGTSMAAPHVAGAAALLAQQHPGWDGEQLKAALVTTADPQRGVTVYQQGGGRLDVADAIGQSLVSAQATVDFGSLPFPQHVETRQVRLTNTATHPTWVRLAAELDGPDGPVRQPAVSVSPSRVRLATGASTTVTVRLDAGRLSPGTYSGYLAADGAGPDLHLPLGVIAQPELHTVHVRAVDRHGAPAAFGLAQVLNVDDMADSPDVYGEPGPGLVRLDAAGEADVAVRSGHYSVMAIVDTADPSSGLSESAALAGDPELTVTGERSVTIDARTTVPVSVTLAGQATDAFAVTVGQTRTDASGVATVTGQLEVTTSVDDQDRLFVQPTGSLHVGRMETRTAWRLYVRDAPEVVNTVYVGTGWTDDERRTVTAADLAAAARAEVTYHTLGTGVYYEGAAFTTPMRLNTFTLIVPFTAPVRRVEYYVADASVRFQQCLDLFLPFGPPASQWCDRAWARHPAGEHLTSEWLRGPLLPTLEATHSGDTLTLRMHESLDRADHAQDLFGFGVRSAHYTLSRDGAQLAEGVLPIGNYAIGDHGQAQFRLTRSIEFDPAVFGRTTAADTTWTFTASGHGSVAPPVLTVDVDADVDLTNRVTAGAPLDLRLTVGHVDGARATPIRTARVWTSADGGTSWQQATVHPLGHGRYAVSAAAPASGTSVSLRVDATDTHGNRIVQEVIGALGVTG